MPHDAFLSPGPRLLEVHEVAYLLKCSQETVRRLIRDGKLPAIRVGRHFRVDQRDLQTFLEAQRVASGSDAHRREPAVHPLREAAQR